MISMDAIAVPGGDPFRSGVHGEMFVGRSREPFSMSIQAVLLRGRAAPICARLIELLRIGVPKEVVREALKLAPHDLAAD